jgi:GMP synthase (glutamine-hydrolysing)
LGEWLVDSGVMLRVARPDVGDPLPTDLAAYQGLVVLGGSMGATDDHRAPWLEPTRGLLREAAEHGVPALGVCLGHQVAAVALGGRVAPNPRGQTMGLHPVSWTPAAATDPLLAALVAAHPRPVAVHWNDDIVVTGPPGSVALATAPHGELLAARFAPTVWGLQWHPEAGADVVRPWAEDDRSRAAALGVSVDEHVEAIRAAEPALRHTWSGLAGTFAALARAASLRVAAQSR